MKLSQLAAKPQLIKVSIDDEEIQTQFGEALEFWIWDRQDMEIFVKMATLDYKDFGALTTLVKDLVLDEEGHPIVKDGLVLPTDVLM